MKNSNSKLIIKNWSIYTTHLVGIQLYEFEDEYERIYYRSAIVNILNDGRGDDLDITDSRAIIIMTDIFNYEAEDCVLETLSLIRQLYDNVARSVLVFDLNKKLTDKLDINELVESIKEKQFDQYQFTNLTIH